jgi:hypothetical protein
MMMGGRLQDPTALFSRREPPLLTARSWEELSWALRD